MEDLCVACRRTFLVSDQLFTGYLKPHISIYDGASNAPTAVPIRAAPLRTIDHRCGATHTKPPYVSLCRYLPTRSA